MQMNRCDSLARCLDLDQLNLILAVQGSPSQEDLTCILNDKVCYDLLSFLCVYIFGSQFLNLIQSFLFRLA